jgi:hypothetical protein
LLPDFEELDDGDAAGLLDLDGVLVAGELDAFELLLDGVGVEDLADDAAPMVGVLEAFMPLLGLELLDAPLLLVADDLAAPPPAAAPCDVDPDCEDELLEEEPFVLELS